MTSRRGARDDGTTPAPQLAVTLTVEQLRELVEDAVARAVAAVVARQQREVLDLEGCAALLKRSEDVVMRVLVKHKGLPVQYISEREPRFRRSQVMAWLDTLPSRLGAHNDGTWTPGPVPLEKK